MSSETALPASGQATLVSVAGPPTSKAKKAKPESATGPAWNAYAEEYQQLYAVAPLRSAKINSQFKQLVDLLGCEVAAQVAAFYVRSKSRFYVDRMHPVDLLLRDASALHTQWRTGYVPPTTGAVASRHTGFDRKNYRKDINADGSF